MNNPQTAGHTFMALVIDEWKKAEPAEPMEKFYGGVDPAPGGDQTVEWVHYGGNFQSLNRITRLSKITRPRSRKQRLRQRELARRRNNLWLTEGELERMMVKLVQDKAERMEANL